MRAFCVTISGRSSILTRFLIWPRLSFDPYFFLRLPKMLVQGAAIALIRFYLGLFRAITSFTLVTLQFPAHG
jgi:hypothetical protein